MTHTVFPGVVIGYLAGGVGGVFPGALVAGAVTAVLLTLATRSRRVSDDTALAVLLAAMFAVGVVLVSRRTSYTADLTALLFGRLLTVSTVQIGQTAAVTGLVLAVLAAFAKELQLRAFDPEGTAALGYRVAVLDLILNTTIALVVVAAAQSVGTVLVIALLVVPAAARPAARRPDGADHSGRGVGGRARRLPRTGRQLRRLGGLRAPAGQRRQRRAHTGQHLRDDTRGGVGAAARGEGAWWAGLTSPSTGHWSRPCWSGSRPG